jgi:hypothetical protein
LIKKFYKLARICLGVHLAVSECSGGIDQPGELSSMGGGDVSGHLVGRANEVAKGSSVEFVSLIALIGSAHIRAPFRDMGIEVSNALLFVRAGSQPMGVVTSPEGHNGPENENDWIWTHWGWYPAIWCATFWIGWVTYGRRKLRPNAPSSPTPKAFGAADG